MLCLLIFLQKYPNPKAYLFLRGLLLDICFANFALNSCVSAKICVNYVCSLEVVISKESGSLSSLFVLAEVVVVSVPVSDHEGSVYFWGDG